MQVNGTSWGDDEPDDGWSAYILVSVHAARKALLVPAAEAAARAADTQLEALIPYCLCRARQGRERSSQRICLSTGVDRGTAEAGRLSSTAAHLVELLDELHS